MDDNKEKKPLFSPFAEFPQEVRLYLMRNFFFWVLLVGLSVYLLTKIWTVKTFLVFLMLCLAYMAYILYQYAGFSSGAIMAYEGEVVGAASSYQTIPVLKTTMGHAYAVLDCGDYKLRITVNGFDNPVDGETIRVYARRSDLVEENDNTFVISSPVIVFHAKT